MNKGQYLTVEQVFLFMIGLIITLTIYYSFSTVSDNIKNVTEEDQLFDVGNFISLGIIKASLGSESTVLTFKIPTKISGENYKIYVENEELKISLKEREIKFSLNNMKDYNINGILSSSGGNIKIEKIGNEIKLSRNI